MNHGDDLASYNMINSKKDDGDDHEIQLQRMKQQEHYIEAQIEQGDTLQAIALRFYCSVSIQALYKVWHSSSIACYVTIVAVHRHLW